ncbi:general transcription factor IIH subunit 5 [Leptopilina heterotoma]|uniref:general transcription factor IIH subunit 5 n=1 Tax=Leptopilina heterotoma TaxID=63436 RepID=UPI001CA84F10|nr:general transcription factor IIH subunit 5 [Leptopilina heterotoma]
MVNVTKGILVECDEAMKQLLLDLDEKNVLGRKFIIQDLDERHLFISADILDLLRKKVEDLGGDISVPSGDK